MRVADYIISKLYENGVDTIFSVSGRGTLFLTDAIAKHSLINYIGVHHEQSAAFAAFGYSQSKNDLSACLVSTGCASTNALTGLLCAWQDNLPCVFISGQNILEETTHHTGLNIRTYGQQEANIIPIVKSITKYAKMIESPDQIEYEFDKAIKIALEGRHGPVWLDIPLDIQSSRISILNKVYKQKPIIGTRDDSKDFFKIYKKIQNSKRPVVLIGTGIRSSKAESVLEKFIKKYNLPLVYSHSAPDVYGSKNKLSIGSVGSMGSSRAGNFAIQNSDLVLVIGNRLSSYTTGLDFCNFAREAEIIVVDIDEIEHQKKTININLFIKQDAKAFLNNLINEDLQLDINDWTNKCLYWKNIFKEIEPEFISTDLIDLYELSNCLSSNLPSECNIITDSGFIEVILPTNIRFGKNQRLIHPASQGSMGFALPGSIGVCYSSKLPTFVVVGDGSIMMNIQELETIKNLNLNVKILVINNDIYGIIRRRQNDLFRKRTIGTDSSNGISVPDFKKVAFSYGINYQRIDSKKDLNSGIEILIRSKGPVLCEVMCRKDQSYIETGIAKDQNGKFVRRPLEDQTPFLDRKLFLKEMIIKPINQ